MSDYRDDAPTEAEDEPLANIEAEQAFLGALMFENEVHHEVASWLAAEHFYDPVHARIYEAIGQRIAAGQLADAVTIKTIFEKDAGLQELGGVVYLVDLMREAPEPSSAPEYARLVRDLAQRRALVAFSKELAADAREAYDAPVSTLIETAEQTLCTLAMGQTRGSARVLSWSQMLSGADDDIREAMKGTFTTPTGLNDLDRILGGYAPGELIIPAGRPGMGKTLFGGALCAHAAKKGHASAFVAVEMRGERMGVRWLAAEAGVPYSAMRHGKLDERQYNLVQDARERMAGWGDLITTIDMPGASVPRLLAYLRRVKRSMDRAGTPLRFVVIDYLQKLKAHTNRGSSKVAEIADISNALKDMARELEIAVVCPCQLNRDVEGRDGKDKRPRLADLKWSGEIEQDADVVLGLHRDAYYAEREPEQKEPALEQDRLHRASRKVLDVIVLKNREGEAGRSVELFCDPATGRIEDLEQGRMEL